MHENPESGALALAIVVLRALRGWTQAELAAAAGTSASVVSEYESGKRPPTRKAVDRFALAVDVPTYEIDDLLPALRSLLTSTGKSSSDLTREELAVKTARKAEGLILDALKLVLDPGFKKVPPSEIEERLEAKGLWEQIQPLCERHRRLLIEEGAAFQTWALCELLCEESFRAAERKGNEAVELAELALHVAGRIRGEPAWRSRVQGYAWGFLGHARRVQGDLEGAREAFSRYRTLWRQEASSAAAPLAADRLREIEAQAPGDLLQPAETVPFLPQTEPFRLRTKERYGTEPLRPRMV